MTGLLIALVCIQSVSLVIQMSHAGATQKLLNLVTLNRPRL